MTLHPAFALGQAGRAAVSCLPFADTEALVRPVWQVLADRAAEQGWDMSAPAPTEDADLHLMVGTRRIDPVAVAGQRYTFVMPNADAPVRLMSRSGYPGDAKPWIADDRRLGVMVRRLVFQQEDTAMDNPALADGWWAAERDDGWIGRWTRGDAVLPFRGMGVLAVELSQTIAYLAEPAVPAVSARRVAAA